MVLVGMVRSIEKQKQYFGITITTKRSDEIVFFRNNRDIHSEDKSKRTRIDVGDLFFFVGGSIVVSNGRQSDDVEREMRCEGIRAALKELMVRDRYEFQNG